MSAGAAALQRRSTVHVVDDDASIRSALSRLFRASGHAVRTFGSAQAYLAEASPEEPGCVVLDIRMPGMDGLTLQERMSNRGFNAPIVFVSAHGDISASVRAMKGGAVDFLEKPFEEDDLLGAVDRAIALDTELRERRSSSARFRRGLENLTSREYEVMTHVIAGKLNKVIARELDISEKTVKTHRSRVMKKMDARSLADLVRMAERAGVLAAKPYDSAGVV
ncbi:MAG: response regulator transcription factor [Gemmatimonadetes bacterium]|nr:response regulator transcription factor [Gemmatimonadota bacterium]